MDLLDAGRKPLYLKDLRNGAHELMSLTVWSDPTAKVVVSCPIAMSQKSSERNSVRNRWRNRAVSRIRIKSLRELHQTRWSGQSSAD
jgi:hypothetical protein